VSLAANEGAISVIDFMVQFGQVAIGAALILGLATRFAAAAGALMMLFFFVAAWDFAYGIVNQHLTYAVVTFGLAIVGAGNFNGLDARIANQLPAWARDYFASGAPVKAGGSA
jgi:thiosulfate dehydrogenase [quinone] large subunit